MFELIQSLIIDIFGLSLQDTFYTLAIVYLTAIPIIKFIRWLKYGRNSKHNQ